MIRSMMVLCLLFAGLAKAQPVEPVVELDIRDVNVVDVTVRIDREYAFPGRYRLTAAVGPRTVPVDLDLELVEFTYLGRMKVHLPEPVNVSLRSYRVEDDSLHFRSSSPVTSVKLWHAGADSLKGILALNGGAEITLAGTREGSPPDDLAGLFGRFTLFEEGTVSRRERGEAFVTFDPGRGELYFSSYSGDFGEQTILRADRDGRGWSHSGTASFSGTYSDRSPAFSLDGSQLYFASTRPPQPGEARNEDFDLWRVHREADGSWSTPERLEGVNSDGDDYQPCVTDTGIYFISNRPGGAGGQDVYYARFMAGGGLSEPVLLGPDVNSDAGEISVYVDREERYMILSSSKALKGARGNDDLYLLRKMDDGWSESVNLGPSVNSFANEYGAFISPDGKTLYYGSDVLPPANIHIADFEELLWDIGW